jgi:hypothetical protein
MVEITLATGRIGSVALLLGRFHRLPA